jgi:hypothetical protein
VSERRWDIVLRIASGPLASREPAVYRGPHVVVGTSPGAGGVVLPGGRGIAHQHCTISAYDPHTVFVTPVGHNPVRVAPYTDVRWEELEPITGRVRLQRGNAVHLGPTGQRGVTLEFLECRDLGMQTVGRIVSDTADESIFARPPDGIRARGRRPDVRQLFTDTYDPGTFRILMASLVGGSAILFVLAVAIIVQVVSPTLTKHGEEIWEVTDFEFKGEFEVHQGFDQALVDLVIDPNRRYAGERGEELLPDDPKKWDPRFFQSVQDVTESLAKSRCAFRRLEEVRAHYKTVVDLVREAGLPEVLAGVPMVESRYRNDALSPCCAAGWWQYMPEAGVRLKHDLGPQFSVERCHFAGNRDAPTFDPKDPAPPPGSCNPANPKAAYIEPNGAIPKCMLADCEVDFRTDLVLSTRAAIFTIGEALRDPSLAGSGAAVQIAIASHNAGYHDAALFRSNPPNKTHNLLPAYLRWKGERDSSISTAWFHGNVQRCRSTVDPAPGCQAYMMAETQRYAPNVVAWHLIAMCYYAHNYKSEDTFGPWSTYWQEGGYCQTLNVPSAQEAGKLCVGARL